MPFLERVCLCGSKLGATMPAFIFPDSELAWQRAVFGAWFVNVLLGVGRGSREGGRRGKLWKISNVYKSRENKHKPSFAYYLAQ